MTAQDPCSLGAAEARRLIGRKALSPVELLESCAARIEATNPRVNAVVALDLDRAREAARAAERAVVAGEPLGPLHGLPVAIKDLTETAGLRTTFGSLLYKDHVPARDDSIVAGLRRAGGVIVAKTNTPEFGTGANTTNAVYGPTGNPFDPERTCGGSSGGSAVALALDMVPLATGSDFGGSLRIPAAWCGVVGFRPTPGLVPQSRKARGWSPLSVEGPMARSVEDLRLLLSAMAGDDPGDPLSRPVDASAFRSLVQPDPSTLRIGVTEDLGFAPVDRRIRETFRAHLRVIEAAVASVEGVRPRMGEADEAFAVLRGAGYLSSHGERVARAADRIGANVVDNVRYAETLTLRQVVDAEAVQTRIARDFQGLFSRVDAVVLPCTAVPPFAKLEGHCGEIDGVAMNSYYQWIALTYGLTLAACPVACIPCGLDPTGMPFGIQVAGPKGADLKVLAVAGALEAVLNASPETRRPVPPAA